MTEEVIQLPDKSNLRFKVINNRVIFVQGIKEDSEIYDDKGNLVGLNYCEDLKIQRGITLTIKKNKYKILELQKVSNSQNVVKQGYYLFIHKKLTKTSTFILPFIGVSKAYFRWNLDFTNAFLGIEEDGNYGEYLYLLYRFNGDIGFSEFETRMKAHKMFISLKDPDKHQVLFKFKLPNEGIIKDSINLILEGKYSKLSEEVKEHILKFHDSSKDRPLGQILFKTEERRKFLEKDISKFNTSKVIIDKNAELFDKFIPEEEIFLNEYIIN